MEGAWGLGGGGRGFVGLRGGGGLLGLIGVGLRCLGVKISYYGD